MSTQDPVSSDAPAFDAAPAVPRAFDTVAVRLRALLAPQGRSERSARLPPSRREVFDRIRQRRDQMNPVSFSLVAAVREMREHG